MQAEILNLPSAYRARLIEQLIASLDRDAETEMAWDLLAIERKLQLDSGAGKSAPLADVAKRLEARFPG
ncbi:addiction module protein [Methylotetracoccus oryzae]|uniref:addiction module protein n=1 Tax=Methylotetracoccus oryzae TaxID=1919059 RepID=UPI001119C2C0|nr:addiction module protein [Methylotetracoccus oryzae]